MQTEREAIDAVRQGQRARTKSSLHPEEKPGAEHCKHHWRVIACDFDDDVLECAECGTQRVCSCNFDDDTN